MLATKAFGMGIDINDIKEVYHFAPTGNLADYVQEIGRVARDPDMLGVASTDYFKQDFQYVRKLFGISSIRNWEIKATINKILQIFYTREMRRNLIISPEEFGYIFSDCETLSELDVRLKTVLLTIKNDLDITEGLFKYALIVKPQSMFTKGLFMILDKDKKKFESNGWLQKYLKLEYTREEIKSRIGETIISYMGDLYTMNFKKLWEEEYSDYSFGQFKLLFMTNKLPKNPENPQIIQTCTSYLVSYIIVKMKTKNNDLDFSGKTIMRILNDFEKN